MASKLIRRYPRAVLFFVFAFVGFIVYSRVILQGGFIFDDFEYVVGNPILSDLSSLLQNFSDPRQIGYLSFALNYLVGAEAPFGYHLVNVVIHLANAVLVFFLAATLLRLAGWKREQDEAGLFFWLPASIGLIFLVHPLQTQAVSYVTQRFTSLAAFFYLASVTLYLQAREGMANGASGKRPMTNYWLSLLCALLAMKVKEIAFTLPVAILALELLLLGRTSAERKRSIYLVVPFIATMVIVPLSILGPDWGLIDKSVGVAEATRVLKIEDLATRSPLEYFATQMRVLVIYLRLLFFPYPQAAVYDLVASRSLFELRVLSSLALHLFVLAGAVLCWLRSRNAGNARAPFLKLIAIGLGWFYLTASVESSVLPIKDLIFEHRAYLPGVGIIMAVCAACAMAVAGRTENRRFFTPLAGIVLALSLSLGTVAYVRNFVWLNELSFWDDVVAKIPNKAIGYNNRGTALMHAGRLDEALRDLNTTVDYFEKTIGQPLSWEESDFTSDNLAKTYLTRASLYRQLGKFEKADADTQTAKMMVGAPLIPLENRRRTAESFYDNGAFPQAIEVYSEILDWFPDDLDARVGRGSSYSETRAYDKALADLDEAVSRHPDSPLGYYNRAVVNGRLGKRKLRLEDMKKACSMGSPPACESVATLK